MSTLLDLRGLSSRWGLTERVTKKLVRDQGVPFISLGGGDARINWRRVRFREEAIERWEADRQQAFVKKPESLAPPVFDPARTLEIPAGKSLLGDWRGKRKTGGRCR